MLSVIVDWLEFTVLDEQLPIVLDTLGLEWDNFKALEKGRFGYHNQYKWSGGHVYIMFTAEHHDEIDINSKIKTSTGVHVMLTGQGCRQYSAVHDLIRLIRRLYLLKRVNFTRIDLAIDDHESKIIDYNRIQKAALSGHFTSRWSKWDEIISRQTSSNKYLGRTMYFGSQSSDLFCRIYDKSLERKANAEDKTEIPEKWTRLEIVYRKDRAKMLVEHLIIGEKSIGQVLRGTLKQYLRFLLPATYQNKARWPTAQWWSELLKNVERLQLTIKKEAKTIEDMTAWVDKQIAPTLSAIIKAHEGDLSWLIKTLVKGSKRLSQRHKDAIYQYIQKGLTT